MNKNEAFSRVLIDGLLADQGWAITAPNAVRYEVVITDGTTTAKSTFDALLARALS